MSLKRVLITTTINVPHNLRDWRRAGFYDDDVFIIAGDVKTPDQDVMNFLRTLPGDNRYLFCEEQEKWKSSEVIGWNSVQRRNIALLEAIKLRPDWIITVDDDNYPMHSDHAGVLDAILSGANDPDEYEVVSTDTGWWNVCGGLIPPCVHRGFPVTQRHNIVHPVTFKREEMIGVVASLWLGEPDVDASQRLSRDCHVSDFDGQNIVLERGTWCPFNSQATAYRADLANLMAVWPGVGRYDDIWASYLARAVMDTTDYRVFYGMPLVRQDRNAHSNITDLKNELLGLEWTEDLCAVLRASQSASLEQIFNELSKLHFIPEQTKKFFQAWVEDLMSMGATIEIRG